MKQEIKTDKAQSAKGLLSQSLVIDGFVFTAGFIHLTPDGKLIEGSIEEKFKQVMNNIEVVLREAGLTLNDVVKVTLYVTNISILPELNKHYVNYFSEPFPVREAVCVAALPLEASIEMSVVAKK